LQFELRALLLKGISFTAIARQLDLSLSTVSKYRRVFGIALVQRKGGRPALINDKYHRRIVAAIRSGHADTVPEAKQLLGLCCSNQTVRNALGTAGLRARAKARKPLLKTSHRQRRLDFALRHRHWTTEDWARVIFSDESEANRMGSDGRRYCYKMPGEELSSRTVQFTVKHGGGSVMVWGCMSVQGVGDLCFIDGTMDAKKYIQILDQHLPASVRHFRMQHTNWIFQQDGDPKHTSATARNWFEDNDIRALDWPAHSPDLNPIEHLWEHLKRCLNAYETHPTNIYELEARILAEWGKIDRKVCLDSIDSMPRRLADGIRANEGHTKY
ncbi:related to transposase-Wolbachia endosymbiont of Drosophila ananassae, partial [Serendipita indica DSM 11827]